MNHLDPRSLETLHNLHSLLAQPYSYMYFKKSLVDTGDRLEPRWCALLEDGRSMHLPEDALVEDPDGLLPHWNPLFLEQVRLIGWLNALMRIWNEDIQISYGRMSERSERMPDRDALISRVHERMSGQNTLMLDRDERMPAMNELIPDSDELMYGRNALMSTKYVTLFGVLPPFFNNSGLLGSPKP